MPETCLKVLLIENDSEYIDHVRDMLTLVQGQSFELQSSEALLPGLDRLAKGNFDVVLIDTCLPDNHGLDALEALRMHAPAVPIVILSALDSEALALRAVQIGAQDYWSKPNWIPICFIAACVTRSCAKKARQSVPKRNRKVPLRESSGAWAPKAAWEPLPLPVTPVWS